MPPLPSPVLPAPPTNVTGVKHLIGDRAPRVGKPEIVGVVIGIDGFAALRAPDAEVEVRAVRVP